MSSRLRAPAALVAAWLVASTAFAGYFIHFVESDYEATRAMKVPKKHSMGMFVPQNAPAGTELCIGFQNDATNGNRGKIKGTIEVYRGATLIGRGTVAGKVQDNFFVRCLFTVEPLLIGDAVFGDVTMKKLPPLAAGDLFATAVILLPAEGAARTVTTRAPRPWTIERQDWGRMSRPAADPQP